MRTKTKAATHSAETATGVTPKPSSTRPMASVDCSTLSATSPAARYSIRSTAWKTESKGSRRRAKTATAAPMTMMRLACPEKAAIFRYRASTAAPGISRVARVTIDVPSSDGACSGSRTNWRTR